LPATPAVIALAVRTPADAPTNAVALKVNVARTFCPLSAVSAVEVERRP